jgi:hypothetical protein
MVTATTIPGSGRLRKGMPPCHSGLLLPGPLLYLRGTEEETDP